MAANGAQKAPDHWCLPSTDCSNNALFRALCTLLCSLIFKRSFLNTIVSLHKKICCLVYPHLLHLPVSHLWTCSRRPLTERKRRCISVSCRWDALNSLWLLSGPYWIPFRSPAPLECVYPIYLYGTPPCPKDFTVRTLLFFCTVPSLA